MQSGRTAFPSIIRDLPRAAISIDGLNSYLLQGPDQQVLFMEFSEEVEVPPHSHEAQWGVVLDGEIELTIGGDIKRYRKGDTYVIDKDVIHSAKIKAGYRDVTLFNQRNRYCVQEQAWK